MGVIRGLLAAAALAAGAGFTLAAAYIPAKAWLAQWLLVRAWEEHLATGRPSRPWPWADTTPVARLVQPRLGVGQIVLQGASGRVLAFGPGHVTGTALPGARGNVVLSAHRDTHFRWLAQVREGDLLELQAGDGSERRFAVVSVAVHHEREVALLDPLAGDQLRLLTCYPFDAARPGTAQRFVVTARPVPM